MNSHLGEFAAYVQRKVEREGYGSAAEVVREALREMQRRELEEAITRRLEVYILKGIDQGPPDGMSVEEWEKRLTATRERMHQAVHEYSPGRVCSVRATKSRA